MLVFHLLKVKVLAWPCLLCSGIIYSLLQVIRGKDWSRETGSEKPSEVSIAVVEGRHEEALRKWDATGCGKGKDR